jgi:release factor H-coupled RctB family protein
LIGNDIGCGMALFRTDLGRREVKLDRWERRLVGLDSAGPEDAAEWLSRRGVRPDPDGDPALGTIGFGNHFAEVQAVEHVFDSAKAAELGLEPERLTLLVHSGSRSLGEAVLRTHVDRFANAGLADGSTEQAAYMERHNHAVAWAAANRALIARRVLDALSADGELLSDVPHNTVSRGSLEGQPCWLHRKGATSADRGPVVIAGTRGTLSYVVQPVGDGSVNLHTLAHGAGRKWKRSEARGRLEHKFRAADLIRTPLGGRVICEDKDLLFEEAPQAYKDVDRIVADLVDHAAAFVIATLRPPLTYKTRGRSR